VCGPWEPECDWGNYVSPIYCTSLISTSAAGPFVELNLEDKIEFWMLFWNARCEAGAITRKSPVQHTPKHQAFFLLLDVRHHLSLQYWHRNSMGVLSIRLLPNKATSNIRQAHCALPLLCTMVAMPGRRGSCEKHKSGLVAWR
jgi:hypothetical protein